MAKRKETKTRFYGEGDTGANSKFGQVIGEAFAEVVLSFIQEFLAATFPDYILLEPDEGKQLTRLEMFGGTVRQLDTVIVQHGTKNPVALLETKWLKDARHHNDKGAWILQLREVSKKYPTIRGAVAILAGYWTEGVGVMFQSEAGVKMVWVASDEEVYATLQPKLDEYCAEHHLKPIVLDAKQARQRLPSPSHLANFAIQLKERAEIIDIAKTWLEFEKTNQDQTLLRGRDLIEKAISELLKTLPESPQIAKYELLLQIETGNVIYQAFEDVEEMIEFATLHAKDPKAILDKISPKPPSP
ncbi:MAG: hypothetical protein BroJett018_39470 [Chloroflexota bacterium]|nr:MAG: hypothetical protein BroJett018_39470 [Chloroflexota bacterium]